MPPSDPGLIGNCQVAALVHRDGSIAWSCMPRFDSEPVFASLLDDERGGAFRIAPADRQRGVQRYLPNTNVLETTFASAEGSFRVLDFAPRFMLFDRIFRPTKLVRIVEPISGMPRIRVVCSPVLGWSQRRPHREFGSHHVSYRGYDAELRMTTDAPLSYLDGEPFALSSAMRFVLSWGAPVEEPLEPLCDRFFRETVEYWQQWVKHCDLPAIYQEEVIRSALALKLHCFEETGAVVAALTTSIPEFPGLGKTWDYRYCWLRDAYYVLGAFRLLGHFEEREKFLDFLLNVAASAPELDLAPLYRIDGTKNLAEHVLDNWRGFAGEGSVRVGTQAVTQKQHDVFGEMVLALTPLFVDARLYERVTSQVLDLVTQLARKAVSVASQPDAEIWEYKSEWRSQTFSSLVCWAAADRMSRIARRHRPAQAEEFVSAAHRIRNELLRTAVSTSRGCLVADNGGRELDAALLQAVTLRLLPQDDPCLHATVDAIRADLDSGGWLRRYRTDERFGVPVVSFVACSFWLVEALATLGRVEEARALMERLREVNAPLGLVSEDVEQVTKWGNFPQAYSHAGLIHAAFAAAPRWSEYGI